MTLLNFSRSARAGCTSARALGPRHSGNCARRPAVPAASTMSPRIRYLRALPRIPEDWFRVDKRRRMNGLQPQLARRQLVARTRFLGSTPAASTPFLEEIDRIRVDFPPPPLSLQNIARSDRPAQPDGRPERSGADVHAPLRRREVLMPRQFLNGPRGRSAHRQVRAERVPEDVHPRPRMCPPCRPRRRWSCTTFCVIAHPSSAGAPVGRGDADAA